MKRIIIYVLLLALVVVVPVKKVDVADLRPIEVIAIYNVEGEVILKTDTQDAGMGKDAMSALSDMKQTSPAVIYLDTAEYLLIEEGAAEEAEALRGVLKGSVQVCMMQAEIDLQDAAKYLPVHGQLPKLREWKKGDALPSISLENGRIKMLKKSEKQP